MKAVNLLPKGDGRGGVSLPSKWILVAALAPVVAIIGVVLLYSNAHSQVDAKKAELTAVQARLATLNAAASRVSVQTGFVSERAAWELALQDALSKQMPWDVTLNDLARVLPDNVWLTSLNAQSPTPANVAAPVAPPPSTTTTSGSSTTTTTTATTTTATTPAVNPTALSISGYAGSQADVATLLTRLRLLPMLGNVTLGSTNTVKSPTGKPYVQFAVTASIQHPPTGAAT
jgi:Tfp pilus assembly protein PilN